MKEFEDNNFKFYENGGKLSKCVENTEGKGEIARNEQFLLFLQCFQKTCTANVKTRACLGKGWLFTKQTHASSGVFGENLRYCYSLGVVVVIVVVIMVQKL